MLLYLYSVSCIFLIIILGWLGRPPFSSIHIRLINPSTIGNEPVSRVSFSVVIGNL